MNIKTLLAGGLLTALTLGASAALTTATASAAPQPFPTVDGCSARHGVGFCGTWKDINNGRYLSFGGTPKQPGSSGSTFFGFRDTNAPAADTSFYMFHPAQFAADNGAVAQESNAGRSEVPVHYLAADSAGHVFWSATISPSSEWIYDGFGFYNGQTGQFLVIGQFGVSTSPNPARESQTDFIVAS